MHEGRHAVLVEEQVVDRPAAGAVQRIGDAHLAPDQEPSPGRLAVDLAAGQELRVARQEILEDVFGVEAPAGEFGEPAVLKQKDAVAHALLTDQGRSRHGCLGAYFEVGA